MPEMTPNGHRLLANLAVAVARDEQDRVVSCGRVRLLCLEAGSDLAGESVKPRPAV